jgi:DNA-binding CsgD family transcriptional regulator
MSNISNDISTVEYNRLLTITKKLTAFDFANSSSVRASVLEDVMHLLRGDVALSYVFNAQRNAYEDEVYINLNPLVMGDFMEYWQFRDPITPLVRGRRQTVIVTDVIPQKELIKTEFYNDVLSVSTSYYGMSGRAFDGGLEIGDIGIWRRKNRPEFTPKDRLLLDMILPYFTNALRNVRLLAQVRGLKGLWSTLLDNLGLGLLLFDEFNRLMLKNTVMSSFEKDMPRGQYEHLEAHIRSAVTGRTVPGDHKGFSFSIIQVTSPGFNAPITAVIVSRNALPVITPASLQAVFPLSWREAEVCTLVARGLTNMEIASLLGISFSTVRTHLAHVFTKFDVSKRSELVFRLMERQCSFSSYNFSH